MSQWCRHARGGGVPVNTDLDALAYTLVCEDEHSSPATLVRLQQLRRTFT